MNVRKLYGLGMAIGLFLSIPSQAAHANGFETVTQYDWNKTAVEKVLHTFAFRGFATDQQIKT